MKQYQCKDISNGVEDVDMATRKVKAVWARMGNVDLYGDIIAPGAFTRTIEQRGPLGKNLIWSLIDHKASMKSAIGKPAELYVEGDMLIAVTPIIETEAGEDALKLYEAKLINQHSIGFSTIKSDTNNEGVRTITELMLYEGSAVLWAANPETPTLGMYKGLAPDELKETLINRLDNLYKAFRHGTFTDDTFQLLELEIKQIQTAISQLTTQPDAAKQSLDPVENNEVVFEALKQFNNRLKLVK